MFNTGPSELVLLFVVALLVLGPARLPKVAAQIGRWVGRARRMADHLRRQLEREAALIERERPAASAEVGAFAEAGASAASVSAKTAPPAVADPPSG